MKKTFPRDGPMLALNAAKPSLRKHLENHFDLGNRERFGSRSSRCVNAANSRLAGSVSPHECSLLGAAKLSSSLRYKGQLRSFVWTWFSMR